jgi:hypothetical protein
MNGDNLKLARLTGGSSQRAKQIGARRLNHRVNGTLRPPTRMIVSVIIMSVRYPVGRTVKLLFKISVGPGGF